MGIFCEILCYSNVNRLQQLLGNGCTYLRESNSTVRKIPLATYLKHNRLIFWQNFLTGVTQYDLAITLHLRWFCTCYAKTHEWLFYNWSIICLLILRNSFNEMTFDSIIHTSFFDCQIPKLILGDWLPHR